MKRTATIILALILLICIPVSSLASWGCPSCGTSNADSANYCTKCGRAHSASSTCPKCGNTVSSGDVYCGKCGYKLGTSSGSSSNVSSQGYTWPTINIQKVSVTVKPLDDKSERRQSFAGPGSQSYIGAGAYKPHKVVKAVAWFAEDNYVLVELQYQTVADRLVYFKRVSLKNEANNVQSITLPQHQATLNRGCSPKFGPGNDYDTYSSSDVLLYSGETVTGFFQVNNYVFCEFNAVKGKLARGWIPVSYLDAK